MYNWPKWPSSILTIFPKSTLEVKYIDIKNICISIDIFGKSVFVYKTLTVYKLKTIYDIIISINMIITFIVYYSNISIIFMQV